MENTKIEGFGLLEQLMVFCLLIEFFALYSSAISVTTKYLHVDAFSLDMRVEMANLKDKLSMSDASEHQHILERWHVCLNEHYPSYQVKSRRQSEILIIEACFHSYCIEQSIKVI